MADRVQTDRATGELIPRNQQQPKEERPEQKNGQALEDFMKLIQPALTIVMPKIMTPERMAQLALTAVKKTPRLASTTRSSLAGCILQCAQLGLEPNSPLQWAFLIPRENKRIRDERGNPINECTIQIGYHGEIELAQRAGVTMNTDVVHEGDVFKYHYGTGAKFLHVPSPDRDRPEKPVIYAWVQWYVGTREHFRVVPVSEIERRRGFAGDPNSPAWMRHYGAMAMKTAIHVASPVIPKSIEPGRKWARAIMCDEVYGTHDSSVEAFDDEVYGALKKVGLDVGAEYGRFTGATG